MIKSNMTYLRWLIKAKRLYFIDVDKSFWSQCWDLIKHYCIDCFWRNPPYVWVVRNATSKHFPPHLFKELRIGIDDFEQWDIVIVDLIPKNKFWHIFIVHRQFKNKLRYVDQNGIWWAFRNWKVNDISGNWVEMRSMKRWDFKILKAFRPLKKKS
jgi:hypothetical protein